MGRIPESPQEYPLPFFSAELLPGTRHGLEYRQGHIEESFARFRQAAQMHRQAGDRIALQREFSSTISRPCSWGQEKWLEAAEMYQKAIDADRLRCTPIIKGSPPPPGGFMITTVPQGHRPGHHPGLEVRKVTRAWSGSSRYRVRRAQFCLNQAISLSRTTGSRKSGWDGSRDLWRRNSAGPRKISSRHVSRRISSMTRKNPDLEMTQAGLTAHPRRCRRPSTEDFQRSRSACSIRHRPPLRPCLALGASEQKPRIVKNRQGSTRQDALKK